MRICNNFPYRPVCISSQFIGSWQVDFDGAVKSSWLPSLGLLNSDVLGYFTERKLKVAYNIIKSRPDQNTLLKKRANYLNYLHVKAVYIG